ncbi:MAG: SIMPL domain-containing protein, partial [Salibacteraceae bacterium]
MKNLCLSLIFLFLFLTLLQAQTVDEKFFDQPHVEVTGVAKLSVVPDEIVIAIGLQERMEGKDKISVSGQEAALKTAIRNLGIPLEQLTLANAGANYVKLSWRQKDVISKTNYHLEVNDAEKVGQVFAVLNDLKVESAYILRFDHSKQDSLQQAVKIMAIKAAKKKADYLLTAFGEHTCKALHVRETNATLLGNGLRNDNYRVNFNTSYEAINDQEDNTELQFTEIELE